MKKAIFCLLLFTGMVATTLYAQAQNQPVNNKTSTPSGSATAVEGWFFRAVSGYPAAIAFEPVVLFKNGDYLDIADETVESLNVADSKSKRPAAWGTWKKNGNTYVLTNNNGKSHDYTLGKGNWFPAYAYTGSIALKPAYKKVSGGDYGNGVNTLSISTIHFTDATHFTLGKNTGISTPNATAGNKSATGGTYHISGHTITLTYNDGKTVKKSFALGASGSPAKPVNTMIFIGGDAYTDTE